MEARHAPGLLIEGPPGTGKSQTIVNMVADAIGRKKSLLVICQKQAALEVVKKRLDAEGLDDRIFMVTDMNRDREPLLKAIRDQLQALAMQPSGAYRHGGGSERISHSRSRRSKVILISITKRSTNPMSTRADLPRALVGPHPT